MRATLPRAPWLTSSMIVAGLKLWAGFHEVTAQPLVLDADGTLGCWLSRAEGDGFEPPAGRVGTVRSTGLSYPPMSGATVW